LHTPVVLLTLAAALGCLSMCPKVSEMPPTLLPTTLVIPPPNVAVVFVRSMERGGSIVGGRVIELNEVLVCLCPSSKEVDSNVVLWHARFVVIDTGVGFYVLFIAREYGPNDTDYLRK
jgi:hypothetical protein